jgi:hypothetical protein
MPFASTRIVPPNLELDAVLTTALDASLLAGVVAGVIAALELLLELFELLPQPASSAAAVSNEIRNFGEVRKMSLPCRELFESSSSSDLKMRLRRCPSHRHGFGGRSAGRAASGGRAASVPSGSKFP